MNTPDKVNNYEKEHFLSLFARVITGAVPRILQESLTDRQTDRQPIPISASKVHR